MQNYIYVQSASGKPLMPTTRTGHVRRLLNAGKTLQIEVYDDKLVVLPVTGGEGRDRYVSMACILMAATASLLIYKKRKTTI